MSGNYVSIFFLQSNDVKYLQETSLVRNVLIPLLLEFQQAAFFFFFPDGLTALSFSISSLTVIGMLAAITYTVSCYTNVSALYIHDTCNYHRLHLYGKLSSC